VCGVPGGKQEDLKYLNKAKEWVDPLLLCTARQQEAWFPVIYKHAVRLNPTGEKKRLRPTGFYP